MCVVGSSAYLGVLQIALIHLKAAYLRHIYTLRSYRFYFNEQYGMDIIESIQRPIFTDHLATTNIHRTLNASAEKHAFLNQIMI